MKEKRKVERKILTAFTPVYDHGKNTLMGYLRDLTLQGAMLVGSRPMTPQEDVTLTIEFQDTPEIPVTRITVPTRVAWCQHEEGSDYYNTGIEFLDLTHQDRKVIEAVLQRYQFRQEPPFSSDA